MIRLISLVLVLIAVISSVESEADNESKLSSILLPSSDKSSRITRSYYERYGYGRPYDRRDDRRCGRCDDDDDSDDDRDDRRSNKPAYGSRHDRNRDDDDDDDKRYNTDRRSNKNETDDQGDNKGHDDKDRHRDRSRNRHRDRYDDRDRYGIDYYDRFLRDRYRDRYDDPNPRRPVYNRNAYPYDDRYGRYDGYRRPAYYDDRYDRYDDGYGGYGPGVGAGPHDRPWDETYRGQSGWDAGGRGYYFASGRPDAAAWSQRDYARPQSSGGWQSAYQSNPSYSNDYSSGYRDPYRNTGPASYGTGYGGYQDVGYSQSSGWRNVENRRPYRDESIFGFGYRSPGYARYPEVQSTFKPEDRRYSGSSGHQTFYGLNVAERRPYRDESGVTKLNTQYNQGTDNRYGRPSQSSSYQPLSTSQVTTETGYLLGREDQLVKVEDSTQKDAQ